MVGVTEGNTDRYNNKLRCNNNKYGLIF